MGKKEALEFLKKSNRSIIKAWENYKHEIGRTENTKLDDVFKQMFKAWTLSNQRAIDLLENRSQKSQKTKTIRGKKVTKPTS